MDVLQRISELSRPTGEEDVLRVRYPEPRLQVATKHAVGLAAVVIVGVLLWAAVQALVSGSGADDEAPLWEAVATETEVPERVVVAVVGEVSHPGLVTLDQGARVADALERAQPLPHADVLALNLAQVLVDGQQLVVPALGAAPVPASGGDGAAGSGGVSLNSASVSELVALPGVGEATATAIVRHRETQGPFRSVEDLMQVKGIGPSKFAALRDLVVL